MTQTVTPIKPDTLVRCVEFINLACDAEKDFEMVIRTTDNSLAGKQIALANIWYKDIAQGMGDTIKEVEATCKIDFGVPILTADDHTYREFIAKFLGGRTRTECIEIALNFDIPVIRKAVMSTEQRGAYLSAIQVKYAENGIFLTSPSEKELLNCREAQK